MTGCPRCQSAGNGQCVCDAGRLQGQGMAAAMLDPVKTREMLGRLQAVPAKPTGPIERERRLRSLAREAIRCAVESVVRTRRSDGNRVDTRVLERALEALDEFRAACDPQTLLDVLDGEDE